MTFQAKRQWKLFPLNWAPPAVRLVRDEKYGGVVPPGAPLDQQLSETPQRLLGVDFARGVVGGVDEDRPGVGADGPVDGVQVQIVTS